MIKLNKEAKKVAEFRCILESLNCGWDVLNHYRVLSTAIFSIIIYIKARH